MKLPVNYVEKVYAGWLGKVIGVRHGACIEGWKADQIREKYGEITGYVYPYKNFRPDDDTNGPIFFVRVLSDYTHSEDVTPEMMGLNLLNYSPFERGFFWWGGYGKSTSHTAYLNLYHGAKAPDSGSIKLNGKTVAQEICAQIFIDCWGLVNPGDVHRAARYAAKMASVTHDGEAIFGAMFIAACISAAFVERDIYQVIRQALTVIPATSEYAVMVRDLMSFHEKNPDDFRAALAYSLKHYGYDRHKGPCPIIPNGGVVMIALLYGEGDFSKTINIGAMCGEDTDCNVGNAGCIAGVLCGLDGIDYKTWRKPLNDFLVTSSSLPSMNIRDLANDALYYASLGSLIAGSPLPEKYQRLLAGDAPRFHFGLPGSTHAFRTDRMNVQLDHAAGKGKGQGNALRVKADANIQEPIRVYRQTYYRREDFGADMTIYYPAFTSEVFPGNTVKASLSIPQGWKVRLFAQDMNNQQTMYSDEAGPAEWADLALKVPGGDALVDQIGFEFTPDGGHALEAYISHLDITGETDYIFNFVKSGMQVWSFDFTEVAQCATYKGKWYVNSDGQLHGSCADRGELYFGSHQLSDYTFSARMTPRFGSSHLILARVQGALRAYAVGLFANNKLVLMKNNNGYSELASCHFEWHHDESYELVCTLQGRRIIVTWQEQVLIDYVDQDNPLLSGAVGLAVLNLSHCDYSNLHIKSPSV